MILYGKIFSYFIKYYRFPINIFDRLEIFYKNSLTLHLIIFKYYFCCFAKIFLIFFYMLACSYAFSRSLAMTHCNGFKTG